MTSSQIGTRRGESKGAILFPALARAQLSFALCCTGLCCCSLVNSGLTCINFRQDKFDNLTGETLRGKVVINVSSSSEGIDEIPALAGNVYSMEVPLVKGVATVQNLLMQENTAGKDGQEYLLNFSAQIPPNASLHPIPPFTLAFLFYNGETSLSFIDNTA